MSDKHNNAKSKKTMDAANTEMILLIRIRDKIGNFAAHLMYGKTLVLAQEVKYLGVV